MASNRYPSVRPNSHKQDVNVAHGEHFDSHGQITTDPTKLTGPDGKPMKVDHQKLSPQEKRKRQKLHDTKYHNE